MRKKRVVEDAYCDVCGEPANGSIYITMNCNDSVDDWNCPLDLCQEHAYGLREMLFKHPEYIWLNSKEMLKKLKAYLKKHPVHDSFARSQAANRAMDDDAL